MVGGKRGDEEEEECAMQWTFWLQDLVSNEMKEVVVSGTVVVVEVDNEELKDCCNQRDASVSGVGLFRKMSKSGIHCSIFPRFLFLVWNQRKLQVFRESAGNLLNGQSI